MLQWSGEREGCNWQHGVGGARPQAELQAHDDGKVTRCEMSIVFYISTLGSLEETIAETQTVPENLPEVLNDFEEEEEVGHKLSTVGSSLLRL